MSKRIITTALLALSIGLGATAANAGILGDLAGKVLDRGKGQSTSQSAQPSQQTSFGSSRRLNPEYSACFVRSWNAVVPSERNRLIPDIRKGCAVKFPMYI